MPRLLSAAIAGMAVLLLTGSAHAGAEDVQGLGFRGRAPEGFRASSSQDEVRSTERVFERLVPSGGSLVLTFRAHDSTNTQIARTEMALGRMVEGTPGAPGQPAVEPHVTPTKLSGADDAYEVVTRDHQHIERTVTGRLDSVILTVTLKAPIAAEDEVEEAWAEVKRTVRMEHPGANLGTIVVWVLVALVVLAVLLTLMKASRSRSKPVRPTPSSQTLEHRPAAPVLPRDPFAPSSVMPAPQVPAPAPEPVAASPLAAELDAVLGNGTTTGPAPQTSATPAPSDAVRAAPATLEGPRPAFSRAEDGLPIFTPEQKAAGISDQPVRRRPDPVRSVPPPPKTPPKPALNRPPVPRPPLPAFKITKF